MATHREPTKTLHPKPREKKVRLHLEPQLTQGEIQQLKARAAGDMRSVASYVAFLVIEDLSGRGNGRRKRDAVASPGEQRVGYEIAVSLSPGHKAELQARARDEVRSVSSYVARLIVEDLGRG